MPAHKTVQTPLPLGGAMGITKYLLPWLSLRGIEVAEGLMISSLSFSQIAFLVIRHPLLFDQNLVGGFFQLSRLFLASPLASAILGGLVIGYLVTGVVLPGRVVPERWNIRQTLMSTGIALGAGLVSVVLINLGVLRPNPLGYGLVAAGFFVGPWLRARFHLLINRSSGPSHEASSSLPNRREVLRSLVVSVPFLAVSAFNAISAISVKDNWRFLQAEKAHVAESGFREVPTDDKTIKVAHLSSGLIRYRVVNPQGRNLVLGFHGFEESLEEFPQELEPILKNLDIQGIFLDRPGVGPVSTLWPGLDLAAWPRLVEEFDNKVLNNQPISIVGHSAGGLYALACAKLKCVRAVALVSTPTPMTIGTLLRTLYRNDVNEVNLIPVKLSAVFMPHRLVPVAQQDCQQILNDWKTYFNGMLNILGPGDHAFLTQNENAFRKNMQTSVLQGAEATLQDLRGLLSSWPLTPADTTRVPILIFYGAGDQLVPPSATAQEFKTYFAPRARLFPFFEGMGHQPFLKHYELIFRELGKLHIEEEKRVCK
jgi:pimeloyl-ACP methyl ester carboxylesterase